MPALTKKDVKDAVIEVLEPFAQAIQNDFGKVNDRLDKIDGDLTYVGSRLDAMDIELMDIKKKLDNIIYRHEFELLKDRIAVLEKRAGVKR